MHFGSTWVSGQHARHVDVSVNLVIGRPGSRALLPARLNLLAEQDPTVQDCLATLVRGTLEYVQNIRSLEYGACTLGKV